MLKLKLLIPLLFLSALCFAQETSNDSFYKRNITAKENIIKLKESALFIRIRNYSQAIGQLKKQNFQNALVRLEDRRALEIADIIGAAQQIKFCKVYYFLDNDYKEILKGNYSKLYDLDGKVSSYTDTNFFILNPYDETMNTLNSSLRGFFMLNKYGEVITKPFPFGVFNNLFKTNAAERLNKLNYDLTQFYQLQLAFDNYLKDKRPNLYKINTQYVAKTGLEKEYYIAYRSFKSNYLVPAKQKYRPQLESNQ